MRERVPGRNGFSPACGIGFFSTRRREAAKKNAKHPATGIMPAFCEPAFAGSTKGKVKARRKAGAKAPFLLRERVPGRNGFWPALRDWLFFNAKARSREEERETSGDRHSAICEPAFAGSAKGKVKARRKAGAKAPFLTDPATNHPAILHLMYYCGRGSQPRCQNIRKA